MKTDRDTYFANLPDDQIAEAIMEKVDDYYTFLHRSGLLQLWKNAYKAYYNSEIVSGEITATGAQNEYRNLNVNHFRSVLTTLKGMIAQQKIAFDCKAANTDVESQAQAILGNGLLEYYTTEKELEDYVDEALEYAIVLSEGWLCSTWNVQGGEVYGYQPETNAPIYEGDLKYSCYLPTQVARDTTKMKFQDNQWFIVVDFMNKWDLIEQFPELAEKIKDISSDPMDRNRYTLYGKYQTDITEDIPVFTLYHKRTPAVPNGKMVTVINDETYLYSGPLPYRSVPLRRLTTSTHIAWNFGYTLAYDLMPIQYGLNILDSIIITNQSTYGVQHITAPRGCNVASTDLAGGLNLVEWDMVEGGGAGPQPLQLTSTAPEIFNYRSSLVNDINLISGANAVSRGDMSSLGKSMSGSAMALIQNMAIQYANSLQKSYIRTLSEVGTDTIRLLRDFAKVPRIAMIAGKANKSYMKEFTGNDLSKINRVTCDVGNPMAQTVAGRVDLAEKYIQQGWATSPEEYTQVMTTGRLDSLIEGPQRIALQIRQENEDLSDGKEAIAMITDDHVKHITSHSRILDALGERLNPELVQRVTTHIQDHINMLGQMAQTNPMLLSILKQPVVQPPQPPGMPSGNGASPEQGPGQPVNGVPTPNLPEPPPNLMQT